MDDDRPADDRAAEGVEHLQAAAREMIAAARAFLDVVDDFVDDGEKVASIAEAVGSLARGAGRAVRADRSTGPDEDDGLDGPVEHIKVS